MKSFLSAAIIFFIFISVSSFSQDTIYLTKALSIAGAYHYGREAIYTDALAYQLYNGTLKKPTEGSSFGNDENQKPVIWQANTADSNNTFKSRTRDRYLYLVYPSDKEETLLLNTTGSSSVYVNGILHSGDAYDAGWLNIPIIIKKGNNEFYVRAYGGAKVALIRPKKPVTLLTQDATLPSIILKAQDTLLQCAVVVVNTTKQPLTDYKISSAIAGKQTIINLPVIPAMTSRKVIFNIDQSGVDTAGKYNCSLQLRSKKVIDEQTITIEAVEKKSRYNSTFVSNIDGSLQYYAITPQHADSTANSALFLSVHGAGVEAKGQAAAYNYKDWGTLVAATNRRPRGFNWEDWGRLDALEVLSIAEEKFHPDPQRIYLTGHSMGGHGTWFLGATYPDKWAAIAPCSGYPSLKDYGSADGKIPDSSLLPVERMLLRGGNQSDVLMLINNYKPLGIYVLHGDSDHVVPVKFARQMRDSLGKFHPDFAYHEVPGADHWYGNQSVDWPPLFEFLKNHIRLPDSLVNTIDFTTSSPGISSSFRWASVVQQIHPLQYSHFSIKRFLKSDSLNCFTDNVQLLKLDLKDFDNNHIIKICFNDSTTIMVKKTGNNDNVYLIKTNNSWMLSDTPLFQQKNPLRYGTFKEAFNKRMVFVYSTKGTKEENENTYSKAIFDAETWYYRGNGAVDIIADKDYSPVKYRGRNVIIYGNASTNTAWNMLLANCPLQVQRGSITADKRTWKGDDLGVYFVWPQPDALCSVGVIAGTGLKGMNAAAANQYFAGGSGFPDFMIFTLDMLKDGAKAVKLAGYFDNNWKLTAADLFASE